MHSQYFILLWLTGNKLIKILFLKHWNKTGTRDTSRERKCSLKREKKELISGRNIKREMYTVKCKKENKKYKRGMLEREMYIT